MKSVIRGAGYVLAHTPDMVLHNGTTQTTERIVNPDSEYLKELPSHIRSFEQAVAYWPNQVYIGNKTPDELAAVAQPWCDKECDCHERYGKFGQMMPQNEFLLLMQACDVFDLVELEAEFVAANREALAANPVMEQSVLDRLKNGNSLEEIQRLVEEEGAEGLYHLGQLVGCVKRAHDIDANLSAHVMHENLVSKASSVLALLNVIHVTGIDRNQVEYVIDCAEEACGDINQRGGGNFAKSAAEIAGLNNASGSDCRAFCAAPAHAMIEAAALVASGTCGEGILEQELFNDRFFAYVSPENALYERSNIRIEDIDLRDLVILSAGNCMRDQIIELCQAKRDMPSHYSFESGSLDTLMRIVDCTSCLTIIPEMAVEYIPADHRDRLKMLAKGATSRKIAVAVRRTYVKSSIIKALTDTIMANAPEVGN